MDRQYALLCTATNKKFVTFWLWIATKTNYIKCSGFPEKLIDTITNSNLYFEFKKTQLKWHGCTSISFYSNRRLSQIDPTAVFDIAAIPPPKFSMVRLLAVDWMIMELKIFFRLCFFFFFVPIKHCGEGKVKDSRQNKKDSRISLWLIL